MPLNGKLVWFFLATLILAAIGRAEASIREGSTAPCDDLIITGTVTNPQGNPVKDVRLRFFLAGKEILLNEEITTSNQGRYEAELTLPPGSLSNAKLQVQAKRTAYRTPDLEKRMILTQSAQSPREFH